MSYVPDKFILHSKYKPTGDQPEAIDKLTKGVENGLTEQVLLGVTGSGKTFTMANIIANVNRPTLVLAHNKTLAAHFTFRVAEHVFLFHFVLRSAMRAFDVHLQSLLSTPTITDTAALARKRKAAHPRNPVSWQVPLRTLTKNKKRGYAA